MSTGVAAPDEGVSMAIYTADVGSAAMIFWTRRLLSNSQLFTRSRASWKPINYTVISGSC